MRRARKEGRGPLALRWAILLALVVGVPACAEDPCTKLPDLWFPPPGTILAEHGVSVQEATTEVCQGGRIEVTITIDNMTCGDAGPFDVALFYDTADGAHLIGTKHVGSLPGCEYVKLTFVWETAHVTPGTHTLIARADATSTVRELSETNNDYTLPSEVLISPYAPLIEVQKALTEPSGGWASPGERITFTVTIENDGCADQKDNPGHEFEDTLPSGLQNPRVASVTSGRAAVQGSTVFWDGAIPSHGSVTIVLEAIVDPQAADGSTICNQGIVHFDRDANGINDQDEVTDDPSSATEDDPTCVRVRIPLTYTPVAGTIDAPTTTEWGMIAFASLLSLSFLVMLVRRRLAVAREDSA